jgi:thioredoxin-dependent peroxiredoxin
MAEITLRGNPIHTVGELPAVGSPAPAFTLTGGKLDDVTLGDFAGKSLVLNIFPSVDTGVCQASVRAFNQKAGSRDDVTVLNVSADLPFAQARFCGAEGIEGVTNASVFRSDFGAAYGVTISDGPMAGLLSRAVVVVDGDGVVAYTEQVPEIGQEPDYDAALGALG